ncbi:MAG: EAL domain-containing protein [Planctomycetaceae bacterium]|nr:EAL domain-containing protein [Planctomycetaceae bacterium]MCA9031999.1 EAL domain-containing protein [Planctomycetaceae bacterium]MCB9952730.1 EAL domain-containing protein [Planctomycetaceae bacterium]
MNLHVAEEPTVAGTEKGVWTLVGCLPPGRSLSKLHIRKASCVVGRKTGVDLQIASDCVSGRHAELIQVGEHLFVRDLGSTNGTFVNRRRVSQPTPVAVGDHIEIADVEFRVEFIAPVDTVAVKSNSKTAPVMDRMDSDWTLSQFENLMREKAVTPHYQPIVRFDDHQLVGLEALARSPMCGLETPARLFQTAQLMGQEVGLSILCRERALEVASSAGTTCSIFLNTHPLESLPVDVYPSLARLRAEFPEIPMVIELHEGAIQNVNSVREFAAQVRGLNIELAYDDFGAGQSRLLELAAIPPDYLKFDAGLIRDIDKASSKHRRLLQMLVDMAKFANTQLVAEGIETLGEAEVCRELGFDMAQGFYYGRPAPLEDANRQLQDTGELPELSAENVGAASGCCIPTS